MSAPSPRSIDYLIVGHLSADLHDGEILLGGTAAYSGLTAAALGLSVGIVTSAAPDLDLEPLARVKTEILSSAESTSYENTYQGGSRTQRLLGRAQDLDLEVVPPAWRQPKIAHLAPIADEVDPEMARDLKEPLLALTPQGWMRRWDAEGRVSRKSWQDVEATLPRAPIALLSWDDVDQEEPWIRSLAERYQLLIVTEGARGARVFRAGEPTRSPAPPASEVDPTGAGDIFAACFLARYHETSDPLEAARFANALASRSVERVGLEGIPQAEEIEAARGSVDS